VVVVVGMFAAAPAGSAATHDIPAELDEVALDLVQVHALERATV
jgi:hypothetical protein